METIDVFFYKLSRKIIAFRDLVEQYFNSSTRDEKILLFLLAFLIAVFLTVCFVIILRLNFNKRIKKLGFVNVTHINIANEVYAKNLFLRVFYFFWNFKKLVIVEAKPLMSITQITPDEVEMKRVEEDVEVEQTAKIVDEPEEETLEVVDKPVNVLEKPVSQVYLSKEVEDFIEARISKHTKTFEESINKHLNKLMENNNELPLSRNEQPKEKMILPFEEAIEEIVLDEPMDEQPVDETKIPVEILAQETIVVEQPEDEKVAPESVEEDEYDPFFDKEIVKKYIVSKYSISGWQIKKEGSKRATRLFNSKKQAVAYATKSKFEFEIK